MDESNDVAVNKNLMLYIKYLKKNKPFLKLLKLEVADANGIYEAIRVYMNEKKISPAKIVTFTSDGAEVMLGKYGVV